MAYSIVSQQQTQVNGIGAATLGAFTPAAGNALIMFTWYDGSPAGTLTISDSTGSNGSGWTDHASIDSGGFTGNGRVTTKDSATATSTTITVTPQNTVSFLGVCILEVSGLSASPYLDSAIQKQTTPGNGTDAVSSGNTGVLASQPAAVIGMLMDCGVNDDQSGSAPTAGTGFNSNTAVWNRAGAKNLSGRPVDKRVTSTAAVAATGTASTGATDTFVSMVVALAEAAADTLMGQQCL